MMDEAVHRLPGISMLPITCLLYTSDAADDLLCVDLGGRRVIKKKKYNPLPPNQLQAHSTPVKR